MQVSISHGPGKLDVTVNVSFAGENPAQQPWAVDWGNGQIYRKAAGVTTAAFTYAEAGPFEIVVASNGVDYSQHVFVGDFPAYDPFKYTWTPAQFVANERAKAAKIGATTGRLNG